MGLQVLQEQLSLTPECKHYRHVKEVPAHLAKYWYQRHKLFHHYNWEIYMTDDAWFGVTPEPVALRIATELPRSTAQPKRPPPQPSSTGKKRRRQPEALDRDPAGAETPATRGPRTLIDLFGGAGGNTIAFANSGHFDHVIAVERDAPTLACAQHNASVYGVPPGVVTWVLGDSFEFMAALKQAHGLGLALGQAHDDAAQHRAGTRPETQRSQASDGASDHGRLQALLRSVRPASTTLFASPPWGGVGYSDRNVFDLGTMQPYDLAALRSACQPFGHALYLPRTSDLRQVAELVRSGPVGKVDVVQYCMEGASKALVAYLPPEWDATTEARDVRQDEGGDSKRLKSAGRDETAST